MDKSPKKYHTARAINESLLKYRLSNWGKSGSKWKSAMMTYKAYRVFGFNRLKAVVCFVSYALHGMWKYR